MPGGVAWGGCAWTPYAGIKKPAGSGGLSISSLQFGLWYSGFSDRGPDFHGLDSGYDFFWFRIWILATVVFPCRYKDATGAATGHILDGAIFDVDQ